MLDKKQIDQLFELCNENEALQLALSEFCDSLYDDLTAINKVFRTQLSICEGSCQLIIQKNPTLSSQKDWENLCNDFEQLTSIIDKYEQYKDRLLLHYSYVDIISLCEKIKLTFDDTARARHIDFSLETDVAHPEIFQHFLCDAEKMQESIFSLLKHAFHIIPDVSYVKIQLKETETMQGMIHVQRDGAMIPPEDLKNLQSGTVSKETFLKHFGILTVKRFVESTHGRLVFDSDEEKTYVTIYL